MPQQKLRNAMTALQGTPIPELPTEVLMLQAELQCKMPNIVSIANIIEKNTTLSGQVLKLINSPVIKRKNPDPVGSIRDAVNILGLDNLYNLVVSAALQNVFDSSGLIQDIMDNSVDVAFCMADVSESVAGISRDEAYMLGLFHNVGAMLLARKDSEQYETIFTNGLSNPNGLIAAEAKAFNTDHTMVGVLIAKKWTLPIKMINAIMLHHTHSCARIQNDDVRAMVAMLKVANAIVAEISFGSYCGGDFRQYEQDGVHELMMEEETISEIRTSLMSYSYKS